jgi:hypothetical protein
LANGEPPTEKHHAAHSCGNGHLGCCNGAHLSWKTSKQNIADKNIHGTALLGERHHQAKLSNVQVIEIRRLLNEGSLTHRQIAELYAVGKAQISCIKTGREWSSVR